MANPVIGEVTRGTRVESIHRGAWVVVDERGRTVAAAGDVEQPVFARSALKLMQALPLVESGAADAAGLSDRELAIATSSHSGEPGHVAAARTILAAAGLGEDALGCGAHWPREITVAIELAAREGKPGRIHNNCSGKHSGFLCTARHLGLATSDYLDPHHPLQAEIRSGIEALSGATLVGDTCAVDGCSAPTYALPLRRFAHAFARLSTGHGLTQSRATAARRLIAAGIAEPWYVAGTGRMGTEIMTRAAGRIYVKSGAEGVYVAALPAEGLALAIKCDDGATRAAEALLGALAARHLEAAPAALADALAAFADAPVRDFNGAEVGRIRAILAD